MTRLNNLEMVRQEAGADAPASFVVMPTPQKGSGMGKLAAFGLGFVAGVATLTITAAIVEKMASQPSENSDNEELLGNPKDDVIDVIGYKGEE